MIRFFKGLKRAADFFSIHPDGLSFVTERRLKDLEASINKSSEVMDWSSFEPIYESLTHDLGEMNVNIHSILEKLNDKQKPATAQLALPAEQAKTTRKRKAVKLQAVEEEVKTVKSKLTQREVKRLLECRDGELYWKVDRGRRAKKGNKAGCITTHAGYRKVFCVGVNGHTYAAGRLVFLMFHGYLPEYVSYIDGNPLNIRIENLRAATKSQLRTSSKKNSNNTSGYKGVFFDKTRGKYKVQISKLDRYYRLGFFDTAKEAHKAYCKAAKKLHGEFAQVE
jgi:hypothetical protein